MSNAKPYAKTVPFKFEHLDLIEVQETEREYIEFNPDKYAVLAQVGLAGTMMYDGRILGVLGYLEMWPGNFEVWVIPSVHAIQYPRVFLRTIKGKLDCVARTHDVERFQSPAIADEMHDKWMQHFGFENEGTMRRYWKGQDFRMWSRINGRISRSK